MWENGGVDHRGGLPVIDLAIACDILNRMRRGRVLWWVLELFCKKEIILSPAALL